MVYDDSGAPMAVHERAYGDGISDSIDYRTSLDQLIRNVVADGKLGGADKILYMNCSQEVVRVLKGRAKTSG
jgi:hypothetical protein